MNQKKKKALKKDLKRLKKYPFGIVTILLFFIIVGAYFYDDIFMQDINSNSSTSQNQVQHQTSLPKEDSKEDSKEFTEATVKRIVDGDTIIVIIQGAEYRLRLIGVNCPEYTSKKEPYGKEATEYTTKMLDGKTIYLQKDVSETDKYGRLLRYVWLEKPEQITEETIQEKMFNSLLVSQGYAYATTYPPDVAYSSHFKNMQQKAREENTGLWKLQ